MLTTRRVLAVMVGSAMLLGAGAAVRADEGPGDGPGHGAGRHGKEPMGFTDAQKAQMKSLREQQEKSVGPLRDQMKIQRDELRLLVDKKAPDNQLTAKLEELKKTRQALREARESFREKLAAILTPTQRARMALRMGRGRGGWGRGPEGPRGEGGPRGGWGGRRGGPDGGFGDHGGEPPADR